MPNKRTLSTKIFICIAVNDVVSSLFGALTFGSTRLAGECTAVYNDTCRYTMIPAGIQ